MVRDEARHVTFGVNYLQEYVNDQLTEDEREGGAQFAYETRVVMRERLIATDVFEHFGWDLEQARQVALESSLMAQFRNLLFTRIMPNLKRIGLLTESVRPKFKQLGILQFEDLGHDGEVDWAELSKPLYEDAS